MLRQLFPFVRNPEMIAQISKATRPVLASVFEAAQLQAALTEMLHQVTSNIVAFDDFGLHSAHRTLHEEDALGVSESAIRHSLLYETAAKTLVHY